MSINTKLSQSELMEPVNPKGPAGNVATPTPNAYVNSTKQQGINSSFSRDSLNYPTGGDSSDYAGIAPNAAGSTNQQAFQMDPASLAAIEQGRYLANTLPPHLALAGEG